MIDGLLDFDGSQTRAISDSTLMQASMNINSLALIGEGVQIEHDLVYLKSSGNNIVLSFTLDVSIVE